MAKFQVDEAQLVGLFMESVFYGRVHFPGRLPVS
jgi:hypothetical protein